MVRAKFRCNTAVPLGDATDTRAPRSFKFNAVTDDGTPENERYHTATPWGSLELSVDNPAVSVEPGRAYYLDFTPAAE